MVDDGVYLSKMVNSEVCKTFIQNKGYQIPSSTTTIKKLVLGYFEEVKKRIIEKIWLLKEKDIKFNISLDEWKSESSTRYINVVLYCLKNIIILGIYPIHGKIDSINMLLTVSTFLTGFGIDMNKEFFCQTFDGALIWSNMGKILRRSTYYA